MLHGNDIQLTAVESNTTGQKQYGLKIFTQKGKLYPRLTNQRAAFLIAV